MITNNDNIKCSPTFLNNGKIAFLEQDEETKEMQLCQMNSDGTNHEVLTHLNPGIDDFLFSPDNSKLIFISQVGNIPKAQELYPELDKATGLIADDLMYLHWDHWMETIPHPFVASFNGKNVTSPHDILKGTKFECPMTPFNSVSDLCWSPDSNFIAFIMKPFTGRDYAFHTQMHLYLYDTQTKIFKNLTENYEKDHGYLSTPVFSPDGKKIAFGMMKRDKFEADINELHIYDFDSNSITKVKSTFKESVGSIVWSHDNETIFFTGGWHGHNGIYQISLKNEVVVQLTTNEFDYNGSLQYLNGHLYILRSSITLPHDLVSIELQSKHVFQITYENKHIFDQLNQVKYEERWIKSSVDDKKIHCYIIYPPNFDSDKKYPCILFCTGGPQSTNSNSWRYR